MEIKEQELKHIYQQNEVVSDDKLDFIVKTMIPYIDSLSKLTRIDFDYFMNIIKNINMIRFSSDDPDIKNLNINKQTCKSYNFNISENCGIILNNQDIPHQKYFLTHEITHFFIKNTLNQDGKLEERSLEVEEKTSRLYEGITETITKKAWEIMEPQNESIGSREDLYILECELADTLMSIMGKQQFLKSIFLDPNTIFYKMKSVTYQEEDLLSYIDKQLMPLVIYRGMYEKEDLQNGNILNSFEAVCDCSKFLKLGNGEISNENKSKRKQ